MPGRSTFTATVCPLARSVARCTCASDAAATGGPKSAKTASTRWPSSCSTAARASSCAKGGSLSCSTVSCAASSAPTTSGRVESSWPNLM